VQLPTEEADNLASVIEQFPLATAKVIGLLDVPPDAVNVTESP